MDRCYYKRGPRPRMWKHIFGNKERAVKSQPITGKSYHRTSPDSSLISRKLQIAKKNTLTKSKVRRLSTGVMREEEALPENIAPRQQEQLTMEQLKQIKQKIESEIQNMQLLHQKEMRDLKAVHANELNDYAEFPNYLKDVQEAPRFLHVVGCHHLSLPHPLLKPDRPDGSVLRLLSKGGRNGAAGVSALKAGVVLGSSDCAVTLGFAHYKSGVEGVQQDYERAKHYFFIAARSDNSEALFMLGEMHERGKGFDASWQLARTFYERAASHGHRKGRKCADEIRRIMARMEFK